MLSLVDLLDFKKTMPREYSAAFGDAAAAEHAALARARSPGQALVRRCHVGTTPRVGDVEDALLCVIADDEPGLLALVCAAFVTQHLDVRAAQVYARRAAGPADEAVDFFWVRVVGPDAGSAVSDGRVELVERTLAQFLGRAEAVEETSDSQSQFKLKAPTARPPAFRPSERSPSVHFDVRSLAEGASVLVLEAPDTPRLLLAITRALASEGVDIVASDVRTTDAWAHDRFTLEIAGAPLDPLARERVLVGIERVLEQAPSPSRSVSSG